MNLAQSLGGPLPADAGFLLDSRTCVTCGLDYERRPGRAYCPSCYYTRYHRGVAKLIAPCPSCGILVFRAKPRVRGSLLCSDCAAAKKRESQARYRASHGKAQNARNRARTYGLSVQEVEALERAQDYACAICRRKVPLHVDHCHETKRVRGMLCPECNKGIGLFAEDCRRLEAAVRYLGAA